ncbi:hypothetical protein COT95_02830 [Candidatus Falkowbacteria bacterium CG10_big_fil_rev_8_21_14_0_10_37_6]|uniref:Uncharacterized protein n=1 Tax=Candidatus Falkowbacteria bacterium CG10_big_fil_rev_8_21_14_0_10_37_6 TaxID=1974563 RepID=A0A2H0V6J4_9BACT|nr:MAG: hypothetical protein COT95_02830 [Candidatus Falkowbacteria bacterium CG10_big_fil_rev_8_21_14_0_10_37_6]
MFENFNRPKINPNEIKIQELIEQLNFLVAQRNTIESNVKNWEGLGDGGMDQTTLGNIEHSIEKITKQIKTLGGEIPYEDGKAA